MHFIALWPTLIVVTVATYTDLRSHRIPNWLVLPFLVGGLSVSVLSSGLSGLEHSALGIGLAAGVLGSLCWLGGMGMGDLKLFAAIGAWIGPSQVVIALVMTGLAGGVMALCWALAGGFLKDSLRGAGRLVLGFAKGGLRPHPELQLDNPRARRMPYAPAIAVGTIFSFFALGV
jgi:prepilin peptidase CpaA